MLPLLEIGGDISRSLRGKAGGVSRRFLWPQILRAQSRGSGEDPRPPEGRYSWRIGISVHDWELEEMFNSITVIGPWDLGSNVWATGSEVLLGRQTRDRRSGEQSESQGPRGQCWGDDIQLRWLRETQGPRAIAWSTSCAQCSPLGSAKCGRYRGWGWL